MTSKEALELAILEFEKDLEEDSNNQWLKNVISGLKVIQKDLERLEMLEKDNKELRKAVKSWNDSIPKLIHENLKLKKAIEILKNKIELPLENDFDVVNKDDIHLYRLRTKCLINEEEYGLLKEVLWNE